MNIYSAQRQPKQLHRKVRNRNVMQDPLQYVQNHKNILCQGDILLNINNQHYQPFCQCKHRFCPQCITNYLIFKIIVNELDIKCLSPECNQHLNEESKAWKNLPQGIKKRYRILKQNNYFDDSSVCPKCLLKHSGSCYSLSQWWEIKNQYFMECPSHFCKRVNEVFDDPVRIVCTCGKKICFKCRYTHLQQINCLSFYQKRQQQRRQKRQPQTQRTIQIRNIMRSIYIQQKSNCIMFLHSALLYPYIVFGFLFIVLATIITILLMVFISPILFCYIDQYYLSNKLVWAIFLTYPISSIILWLILLPKIIKHIWYDFYQKYQIKKKYIMAKRK